MERCRSGRTGRTRNAVNGQLFRGFESLPFRYFMQSRRLAKVVCFFVPMPECKPSA